MTEYNYVGEELDLFALAIRWKHYWYSRIRPYLGREVLEVGAGIGGTTEVVLRIDANYDLWLGLEPDAGMVNILNEKKNNGLFPRCFDCQIGTIDSLDPGRKFDSAIYIDVLEHIEHDADEVARAAEHIKPGGHLIILSPAHQFLYSEFDKSIGHFRRYNTSMLKAITPETLHPHKAFYLDSVGLLTSLGNRLLLHAPLPTRRQILLWDRVMVPLSRFTDRLLLTHLGRSIVFIWKRI